MRVAAVLAASLTLAVICPAETILSVWGAQLGPDSIAGSLAVAQAFESRHPGVRMRMLGLGAGHMNPQKLLTAIVGGSPPDLVFQARFNISDWASRGAFLPLDSYIARDRQAADCPRREEYYDAAWSEAVYNGRIYGIPTGADDRALYWNRGLFRQQKERLTENGLDWRRPPRTWSEMLRYSESGPGSFPILATLGSICTPFKTVLGFSLLTVRPAPSHLPKQPAPSIS